MGKYSFENTTIGEVLDDKEAYEILKKHLPLEKADSLLQAGRSLTFLQAVPFMENAADDLGIENVKEKIEAFRVDLESI